MNSWTLRLSSCKSRSGVGNNFIFYLIILPNNKFRYFRPKKEGDSDHEEEFYYTEREVVAPAPPPTLSHRDMCRPPHEDPEYQRQLVGSFRWESLILFDLTCLFIFSMIPTSILFNYFRQGLLSTMQNGNARPISIPVTHHWANSHSPVSILPRSIIK